MARDFESKKEPSKALGDFEGNYRQILNWTREISALIILSEAFVAEEDGARRGFRVYPYNAIIRELAEEYEARFVPLDRAFRQVKMNRPDHIWATVTVCIRTPPAMP